MHVATGALDVDDRQSVRQPVQPLCVADRLELGDDRSGFVLRSASNGPLSANLR